MKPSVLLLVSLLYFLFSCSSQKEELPIPDNKISYYRLRQVDIDGTETFSKIIHLMPKNGKVEATKLTDQCNNEITGYFLVLEEELSFEPTPDGNGYYLIMNAFITDVDGNLINGSPITCIDGKKPYQITYDAQLDRYTLPRHPDNAYSFPYGTVTIGSTAFVLFNQPTPITLVSFTVKRTDEGVRFDYETEFEYNSDYVEIQRSYDPRIDSGEEWETLTKIPSTNNIEGSKYSYTVAEK